MGKKLVIIGIDSLDPTIIKSNLSVLPNFNRLYEGCSDLKLKSVFPVDTIPAWMSVYTGQNPGRHGIFYVYDIFDSDLSDLTKIDIERLKGNTFWDYANESGKRCVLAFPILVYPPWKIDGVILSKSPREKRINNIETRRNILSFPENISEEFVKQNEMRDLWGGYPGKKKLKSWSDSGKDIILNEAEITIRLLNEERCDLFFCYFSLLDIIQHRLWRFYDRSDPTFIKSRELADVIPAYYKIIDEIVGKIIAASPNAIHMILSDHGHKMRPIKTLNINEHLRRKGFLGIRNAETSLLRLTKPYVRRIILKLMDKLEIESLVLKLISKSKWLTKSAKGVYSSSDQINHTESRAFLSSFAGIKSYSHGGIEINRENLTDIEYEELRDRIMNTLLEIKEPDSNRVVMRWVRKREDLGSGRYVKSIYPDVIFEMVNDIGVGWELNEGLFGISADHKIASGGHAEEGVILIDDNIKGIWKKNVELIDIAPTALMLLGIGYSEEKFDGKCIMKMRDI